MTTKHCPRCERDLPLDGFYKNRAKDDGLMSYCKPCQRAATQRWRDADPERARAVTRSWHARNREKSRAYSRQWRVENPEKAAESRRRVDLKRNRGITVGEYDSMFSAQGGKCAICRCDCVTGKRLAVDHDHETGRIRGLLCANRNNGCGRFRDDPDLLYAAAAYLAPRLALVTA